MVISDQLKEVLTQAVQVVAWRNADINTEDGLFATTDTDAIIRLEMALCEFLKTSSDDIELKEATDIIREL